MEFLKEVKMFNKEYKVIIKEFIENKYAHNPEDGEKIVKDIQKKYTGDCDLILDFNDIDSVNTAFINKIIHGLYEKYPVEVLNKYFKLKNYNELIKETIIKVIENYK